MRCSCGQPASITLPRRELPYCRDCFEHMIASSVRHEAGEKPVLLQRREGYFLNAVEAACKLARREVMYSDDGAVPGCTETQAAAVIEHAFGRKPLERHFPSSITLQELQTFFKAEPPVELDKVTKELISLDKTHPGTSRSISKHVQAR